LPADLQALATLRDGIVLVTGPRNSGKSSTLAALLDCINQERVCHIITIEDPIEFLHNHKRATVHQRELHSDTGNIPMGLRAAMRQAPDVILVSELRERDSVEMAIEAAESGHLLFSSLNAPDHAKAIERIVGFFALTEQEAIRGRLTKNLRCIISQRLLPQKNGNGRVAVVNISNVESLSGQFTKPAMHGNYSDTLDPMDAAIADLVHAGTVDSEAAVTYATAPSQLRLALAKRASR